jgi:hypothetical protein
VFLFVQLFAFDFADHLAGSFPQFEFFIRFRLLVVIGLLGLVWIALGNRLFLLIVGYILAYPVLLVCWVLPRLVVRNWTAVVIFSPAIHSIFKSLKWNFALFAAALVSAFVVLLAPSDPLVIAGMVILGVFLVVHFYKRFRMAFSPSTVFADANKAIEGLWNTIKEQTGEGKSLGFGSKEDEEKYARNMLFLYVTSTVLYRVGERLQNLVKSRKLDIYFVGSLLYTLMITVLVFAIEYTGVERTDPGSFVGAARPQFFDFLGLSFSTVMTAELSPLKPESGIAQMLQYAQLFGSLLMLVLLVFVILTSIRERYKQDIDETVNELRSTSARVGALLETNYELTSAGVEAWLVQFNPLIAKWCLKLRYGEERAQQIIDAHSKQQDALESRHSEPP